MKRSRLYYLLLALLDTGARPSPRRYFSRPSSSAKRSTVLPEDGWRAAAFSSKIRRAILNGELLRKFAGKAAHLIFRRAL